MMKKKIVEGYDSRAIANLFVDKAREKGKPLTIMLLLKLVYFAHGWYLAYTDKALICHSVVVWKYGPVIPRLYFSFRSQGMYIEKHAVSPRGQPYAVSLDGDDTAREVIDFVYEDYAPVGGAKLSAITHREGAPWTQVLIKRGIYARIPNDVIKRYYKNFLE